MTTNLRPIRLTVLCGTLALAAGCSLDEIIQVDPFDRVSEPVIFDDPNQAALLTSSVQAQFECALSSHVFAVALLGGELNSLGNTGIFALDRRTPDKAGGFNGQYAINDCTGSIGSYVPMSSSRWFADKVVTALEGWTDAQVPGRQGLIATAAAYAGYSLIHLGEGYCSMAIDGGPEITPAQVFALAEERFTKAIAAAQAAGGTVGTDILNMARVGRARARINQNKDQEALADAQLVPAIYVKNATRSLGNALRENTLFVNINRVVSAGLAPEYFNVTWNGEPDPRVPAVFVGTTTTNVARWIQTKYTAEASPIPIATGAEAMLIAAEIQGGQAAVTIINALHTVYGLDPYNGGTEQEIQSQVIEERRRQFFIDGHRSYDRLRFNIPLDPAPGSPYRWGGNHGDAKCLPLPDIETLN
jgi:hypothetical protein